MNKITKEIEKHLKEISDMLPKIPTAKVEIKSGADLLKDAKPEDLKGWLKNVKPSGKYKVVSGGSPQAINHYKRLRGAFVSNGWEGVEEYVKPYRKDKGETKVEEIANESTDVQPELENV